MTQYQFLTTAEAAEELQLSARTINRLIASGKLPAVRIGRTVRIERTALTALVDAAAVSQVRVSRAR